MATIGQPLKYPESGWQRIDDRHELITYTGSSWSKPSSSDLYNNTAMLATTKDSSVKFTFKGTKIRLIGAQYTTGSSDISVIIDGAVEKTTQNAGLVYQVLTYEKLGLSNKVHTVEIRNNQNANIWIDAIDIDSSGEFGATGLYKTLFYHSNQYKYISGTNWVTLTTANPTENDYKDYGIDDISTISEDVWLKLIGEIEICYYTTDLRVSEASFNIETKPFTLAEEWEDKEIKIIEYTDDPSITESTIAIETEPFTLYDELGDSVDVLYYTDDPSKTSTELNITANYSPLDEIEGDFDVVTWSDNNASKNVQMSSIPSPQLVKQTDDYYMYGDLLSIVNKLSSSNGTLRYAVSFNEGSTWEVCKFGKWRTIDISSLDTFKKSGMSQYDISLINSVSLKKKGNKIRFAYYIEDNIHNSDPGIAIDNLKLNINSATETIKMDNVAFYVLNTNATIQLTLTGSKLIGILDDSDQGKVQYRILLNDKAYYPSDGSFTRLAPSPQDIDINISDRDIIFNQPNKLKVEFQDYWGETDYWESTFIGSYSGLMFMDESGEYLSDTFGGILKQLDFGIIIAGQTTLTQKVRIKNQLGYAIDNVYLEMDKKYERDGVQVELSRQANPFLPIDYLTYGLTQPDETIDFYVRIATDMRAKPNPNGLFELVVNADRV
ncbi:hypothetical protein [Paenibacillus sp. O199]|uniref:hypothetical protein n=1 Tax=Paenibacillus sp. O199 TaxID=1643925 RepID=UPI0007BF7C07|nr:hypothetical protein [Paenibacillus sp. O199]